MTTPPALLGGSVWEQQLYAHLTTHVDDERELLIAYQNAATESRSAAFRYLVSLLLEDEQRHHRIFREMAQTLLTEVDNRHEDFAIPRIGQWGFERDHIVEVTERFLAKERKDARDLRTLAKELEPVKDKTIWHLLVRLMQDDTDKHIEILAFIKDHAGELPE